MAAKSRILHQTRNFNFESEHVAEIRNRFQSLRSFVFRGQTVDAKRQGIREAFGKLIVGLRQEAAAEPQFFAVDPVANGTEPEAGGGGDEDSIETVDYQSPEYHLKVGPQGELGWTTGSRKHRR